MKNKRNILNTLNARILLVLLVLFVLIAGIIGVVNTRNIRKLYEESYTERLLLTNALMGSLIGSQDVEYYVELMRNQDEAFKRRQVEFYQTRSELFRLQEKGAPEEKQLALLDSLAAFHAETSVFKDEAYWNTLDALKNLKKLSNSTYVYVMADTGLHTADGEPLYTYIFDAEDEGEYSTPEMDGLGTSDTGIQEFQDVFTTKKQTETAVLYQGDFGALYFVCVPILDENNEVIAILGTDLSLADMGNAIGTATLMFNSIIIAVFLVSVLVIYLLLSRSIVKPLGSLTETALTFAEGNLHTTISESALKQRTEIGTLAHAFKSTLDATTLYLNSVPVSLFIMNRDFGTYFRNESFVRRFGDMQAREFMSALYSGNINERLEENLRNENSVVTVWIDGYCFAVMLKEIVLHNMPENSILVIANDITDLMKEKENAQAAAEAKSSFLSRMSHEMRTPMNAIIGMAKVAGDSDSVSNIKHCISAINTSSVQLLNIINDVLDMSKIEAGKLELENVPFNFEKTLMRVCNIIIDSVEKKNQKLNVVLSKGLKLHYIADELRLSQVLSNLLSNAVKFTPEGGTITLTAENTERRDNMAVLRVCVSDTGIGMTDEQVSRLFNAFEQADGSIARKFGGTGLGLAISQSIIEKMGGNIEVESKPGAGTTFSFAVALEIAPHQDTVVFNGIRPDDIKLLIVENDADVLARFISIVDNFGMSADAAKSAEEALALLDSSDKASRAYDIIFLSSEIVSADGNDIIKQMGGRIDKNTVIIITAYLEWHQIEKTARENDITRYITKPIFPSSVLDTIIEVVGDRLKSLEIAAEPADEKPDFTGVHILLVEDVEINREVFLALTEDTGVSTDIAENGLIAVEKFKENPELYDIIVMDIQMPDMDGYEATRIIRASEMPRAKTIPIIAMSANAFKEDIDRCLECGMNDHLAKPIDIAAVFDKIKRYTAKK